MITIALLRGINVGGRHMIPMAQLRELLEGLGLKNVRTLLQSGNAIFEAQSRNGLAREIEDALEERFAFRPAVILRTSPEMKNVLARNPFANRSDVPGDRLLVSFLAGDPAEAELKVGPEEVHIRGREMYVYFPNGQGRSKLSFAAVEKTLGVSGTARNWNTVMKLAELL